MKKYTLKDFAEQVIHENAEPMTASEIWQYGLNKGYDKKGGFVGKTPWITIGRKIDIDIKDILIVNLVYMLSFGQRNFI